MMLSRGAIGTRRVGAHEIEENHELRERETLQNIEKFLKATPMKRAN
jgi:hypothetical protein